MMLDQTEAQSARVILLMLFLSCTALAGCSSFPQPAELRAMAAAYPGGPPSPSIDGRPRYRQLYCGLVTSRSAGSLDAVGCDDLLWRLRDEPGAEGAALEMPEQIRSLRWEQSSAPIAQGQSPAALHNVRPIDPAD